MEEVTQKILIATIVIVLVVLVSYNFESLTGKAVREYKEYPKTKLKNEQTTEINEGLTKITSQVTLETEDENISQQIAEFNFEQQLKDNEIKRKWMDINGLLITILLCILIRNAWIWGNKLKKK